MNLNTISKQKRCYSDKADDVLFVYPFNYNIDEKSKITKTCYELDGEKLFFYKMVEVYGQVL